jgi:hypothetical protein
MIKSNIIGLYKGVGTLITADKKLHLLNKIVVYRKLQFLITWNL